MDDAETHYTMRALELLARGSVAADTLAADLGVDVDTATSLLEQFVEAGYAATAGSPPTYRATARLSQLGAQIVLAADRAQREAPRESPDDSA